MNDHPEPDNILSLDSINRAIELYNDGQLQDSEDLCRQIIQVDQNQAIIFQILGLIALDTDRYQEAIELISRSVEINPEDAGAHTNLGNAYMPGKAYEKALGCFEKARGLTPETVDVHYNVGLISWRLKIYDKAARSLLQALEIKINHPPSLVLLNKVMLAQDTFGDAVFEFGAGIKIVLPDTLNLLTPYVIVEQKQWFEDEIHFMDKLIQPKMRVIDIGANYGVYTLSAAAKKAKVWAFEPTPTVANYLKTSLKENNFNRVEIIEMALSDKPGMATLNININSEGNALSNTPVPPGGDKIEVKTTTLDHCLSDYSWNKIDFIKIDAEGHEANILTGGVDFFKTLSPLVMFELKHKNKINVSLLNDFKEYGYDLYHLIQGLGVLVPFVEEQASLRDELNLFCCKKDKAAELEGRGLLLTNQAIQEFSEPPICDHWQDGITSMAYYTMVYDDKSLEDVMVPGNYQASYLEALHWLVTAISDNHPPLVRYKAVLKAETLLTDITDDEKNNISCLMSLVRALNILGRTYTSLVAIERLLALQKTYGQLDPKEPLVPVIDRFDTITPSSRQDISDWCLAQVHEYRELRRAFSSFGTHTSGLKGLATMEEAGFLSEDMKRRQTMIKKRFGIQN